MHECNVGQAKAVLDGFICQFSLTVHENKSTRRLELLFEEHIDLTAGKRGLVILTEDIVLDLELRETKIVEHATLATLHIALLTDTEAEHTVAFSHVEENFRDVAHHGFTLLVRNLVSVNKWHSKGFTHVAEKPVTQLDV